MEGLKDFLLSLVKVIIPCAIIALIIFLLVKFQPAEVVPPDLDVYGYDDEPTELVLENSNLKFVMDTSTTQFSVEDKLSGAVWYSNPQDVDSDSKALAAEKNNMRSTLLVTYGTINGVWTLYNNYALSIENGLYEIAATEDEIKVNYTIANLKKEYIIPVAVPESRMNELLDKMEKKQQKQVKEYYRKYDINKLRKTDNKEELVAKYPDLVDEPIYVLIDSAADYLRKKIETIFEEIGYTREDYEADLARYEKVSEQDVPLFNISMRYKLEGDRLVVSVPLNEIEYKDKYPIVSLEILPYMGAGKESDEGFIVIPESGGSVITFNNGKQDQNAYTSEIYGWDYGLSRTAVVTETRNAFPAFAIANNGSSFVCVADEGASLASVKADVSGRGNSLNHASFVYDVLHYESYDVSSRSNSAFYVYEAKLPDTTVVQKYCFNETADYVDMAKTFRRYLTDKYPLLGSRSSSELPVVIDVLQAVDKVQQIVGVPVSAAYELTSYDETVELAEAVKALGVDDFSMKLSGWMNGGITHSIPSKIKLIGALGGKKSFEGMISELKNMKIPVYLDAQVDFAYDSNIFDGFIPFRDSARLASREHNEIYSYSTIWYGEEKYKDSYYLLKPQKSDELFNNIKNFAQKQGVGVSMRNFGNILYADYNPKNLYTREDMIAQQRNQLATATAEGTGMMINFGNVYAIEYADVITSMDLTNSNNAIIDYDIPFYQIALHGLVNYTGAPINLAEDYETELLKSVEFGAGLSFVFMMDGAEKLQDTLYTKYYGADFKLWTDKFKSVYDKYNDSFDGMYEMEITGHRLVGDNVRVTEYEDGTAVYINFGFYDEVIGGITVPARDYVVERGEAR